MERQIRSRPRERLSEEEREKINQRIKEEEEKIREERKTHTRRNRLTEDERKIRQIVYKRAYSHRAKLVGARAAEGKIFKWNEEEQAKLEDEKLEKEKRQLQELGKEVEFRKSVKRQYEEQATIMDQERAQRIRAKNLTKEERRLRNRTRCWFYNQKRRTQRAAKDANYRQFLERKKQIGNERLPHGNWSLTLTPEQRRIRDKFSVRAYRLQKAAKAAADKQIAAEADKDAASQAQPPPDIPAPKRRRRLVRPNYHSPPPDESDPNDDPDEPQAPESDPFPRSRDDGPAARSSTGASSGKRLSRALMNLGFEPDEDE